MDGKEGLSDPSGYFSVLDIHRGKHSIRMKTAVKKLFWNYIHELCLSEELMLESALL